MVVGHDHVEPERLRAGDLVDRRDPTVHGEHERVPVLGEPLDRLAREPVPLVEAAREVPVDVGAELAQAYDRERRRADPVDVVVAVDADALAGRDRGSDALAGCARVPEERRIVARRLGRQERPSAFGVAVPAPDEDAGGGPADPERRGEGARLIVRAGTDRPRALLHRAVTVRTASDGVGCRLRCVDELLNVFDYERRAAELLPPGPLAYFAAGAGDEWTLRENVNAYRRWTLRPRLLRDVANVTTTRTVLGVELAAPILVAPMAYQRHAHPEGELAMSRAAAAFGTIMTMSTMATASPAEVAAAAPDAPRWFQLYVFSDEGITRSVLEQAGASGFQAIVLTVDTPYFGRRERDLRSGWLIPDEPAVPALAAAVAGKRRISVADHFRLLSPSVSWRDIERIAGESRLPVLVKGIHTAEDASLAVEHGAAGVIVSNHGGRQLDGVAASIDTLPEVVDAVGESVEVLVDGGIRRGVDVVVALALGARAVLVGRPVLWGLAVDGADGAERVLALLRDELHLALGSVAAARPTTSRAPTWRGLFS